jgi:hypothetical protein
MREICLSGLTSGNRRRSYVSPDCGGDAKAPPTTHREANVTAPVLDSTELDASVFKKPFQPGPVIQRISDRLGTRAAGGQARDLRLVAAAYNVVRIPKLLAGTA